MTDDELKQLVASLAVDSRNLHEAQNRTDEQMNRTDEQIKALRVSQEETNQQMQRTDEKLKSIGIQLGNMSKNQGDVAEAFFYNSLLDRLNLGELQFDDIGRNDQKHRGKVQEEYDIILTNGCAIAIIEVKYKAHKNDLDKLERKITNFKTLFPVYKNYKVYGAMASFHFNDDAREETLKRGYFVLERRGDLIETESEQLKVA